MDTPLVERLIVRGIHVYRFYDKSRQAADAYIKLAEPDIQEHIDTYPEDQPYLYVLDVSRSGMFSVNYVRDRVNEVVKRMPRWPESYIAYVTDNPGDSIMVELINAMTSRQLEHTRKVYKTEDFDLAIDWLVSVREQYMGND